MRSFLVGLGIGIGLGVLFAPMSGEETRSNIRERANDLADQARDTYEQGRERVRTGVASIRDMAQRATGTTGAPAFTGGNRRKQRLNQPSTPGLPASSVLRDAVPFFLTPLLPRVLYSLHWHKPRGSCHPPQETYPPSALPICNCV